MEYCSVKSENFLVFIYGGNSRFHVLVFDLSATEIDYLFNGSPDKDDKLDYQIQVPVQKETDRVDCGILNEFPTNPKTREKSPLTCPRPHKVRRANPAAKTATTSNRSRSVPNSIPDDTQSKKAKLEKLKSQANSHSANQDFRGLESYMFLFMSSVSNDCQQKTLTLWGKL